MVACNVMSQLFAKADATDRINDTPDDRGNGNEGGQGGGRGGGEPERAQRTTFAAQAVDDRSGSPLIFEFISLHQSLPRLACSSGV